MIGEIAFGIGVGWLSLRLRRWARDPRVEITLSLLTPYIAFWIPEHLHGSGVLATVACGLYVSWRGPLLISSATRLQGIFFWDFVVYLVEGLVFLLTGLQARRILDGAYAFSAKDLAIATALTAAIAIAARFVWVFPATYIPRWIFPPVRRRDHRRRGNTRSCSRSPGCAAWCRLPPRWQSRSRWRTARRFRNASSSSSSPSASSSLRWSAPA